VIPPGDWLALVARRYRPDLLLLALAVGTLLDLCLAATLFWTTRRRAREA
jgi:hypothetical protein